MEHKTTKLLFISILVATAQAIAQTPDYYLCNNREGGEWNYGRTPMVCDANSFGDDSVVERNFDAAVFDDVLQRTAERGRYMNEIHAILRDGAKYYIRKKNPTVSNEELNAWVLAVMATASQETYWSHYRQTTDRRLKLMRGDVGHGHGMMQVDDRAHFPAIQQGFGWNMISNLTYGMDILYSGWLRAPSQSCVGSATNYTARIRAAWAAYNGGPGRICRWTNPNDPWARNDQGFYDQLQNKRWLNFVTNAQQSSLTNTICLIENQENCGGNPVEEPATPVLAAKTLYHAADGRICILYQNQANCVRETRDRICLNVLDKPASDTAVSVSDELLNRYSPKVLDRHDLCAKYDSTLLKIGTQGYFATTINLRATPAGGLLTTVPQKSVLEILDFELRNPLANDRYYKVRFGNQTGYVYGGTSQNYKGWVRAATASETTPSTTARVGDTVKVVIASGINLRATPGGAWIDVVPSNARVQVQEVVVRNAAGEVYYKVIYNGRAGYIYSGVLQPENTVKSWTQVQ